MKYVYADENKTRIKIIHNNRTTIIPVDLSNKDYKEILENNIKIEPYDDSQDVKDGLLNSIKNKETTLLKENNITDEKYNELLEIQNLLSMGLDFPDGGNTYKVNNKDYTEKEFTEYFKDLIKNRFKIKNKSKELKEKVEVTAKRSLKNLQSQIDADWLN